MLEEAHGTGESMDLDAVSTVDVNNRNIEVNASSQSSPCSSSVSVSKEPIHLTWFHPFKSSLMLAAAHLTVGTNLESP